MVGEEKVAGTQTWLPPGSPPSSSLDHKKEWPRLGLELPIDTSLHLFGSTKVMWQEMYCFFSAAPGAFSRDAFTTSG